LASRRIGNDPEMAGKLLRSRLECEQVPAALWAEKRRLREVHRVPVLHVFEKRAGSGPATTTMAIPRFCTSSRANLKSASTRRRRLLTQDNYSGFDSAL
jgi:hypothetical protein